MSPLEVLVGNGAILSMVLTFVYFAYGTITFIFCISLDNQPGLLNCKPASPPPLGGLRHACLEVPNFSL